MVGGYLFPNDAWTSLKNSNKKMSVLIFVIVVFFNNQLLTSPNTKIKDNMFTCKHEANCNRPAFLVCLTPSSFSKFLRRPMEDYRVYSRQCWDQLPPCKQPRDLLILKVTCPDAGLPSKHCSSVYAILSALFPGQNVSLIGNSINSHEFTGNTILLKEDIVSLASHQDPIYRAQKKCCPVIRDK